MSPLYYGSNGDGWFSVFVIVPVVGLVIWGLNKFWLYPVSILLHMGVDFFAALYQTGTLSALWVVEVLLAAYVVALFFAARAVYKKLPPEAPTKMLDHFGRVVSG